MTVTTLTKPSLSLEQFPRRDGFYWVPLTWILENTIESIDLGDIRSGDDWERMLSYKCSDTGFMHLVRSIQERGWLSAIGWSEGCITEGHHRLCAAILLCVDEVPCTEWGTNWPTYGANGNRISGHRNAEDPDGLDL